MGESKNRHFYDFEIWGRVPEPQNQLFLSLGTPGDLKKSRTNPGTFFSCMNIKTSEIVFVDFGKDGRRKIPTIRLIRSSES